MAATSHIEVRRARSAATGDQSTAAARKRRRSAHGPEPVQSGPRLLAANIDSLYLSAYIDGPGIDWEGLAYEKEKLRASPGVEYAEIELGCEQFALKRSGRKPYSYILKNRAFELQLGERIEPRCHAQFSSELLWREGFDVAIERFRSIWAKVGARETRPEVIARIDAAFDFAVGMPDFGFNDIVSVATKDAQYRQNRDLQTARFGEGDAVCRIYDKIAEIEQQSEKFWLFDIWGVNEGVWRCEFQIRGPRLKSAGIATIEQLRAHLPELVSTLARTHTSLRIPKRDSNRSRWPLHPMWRELIAATPTLIRPPEHAPPPLLTGIQYPPRPAAYVALGLPEGHCCPVVAQLSRTARDPRPVAQMARAHAAAAPIAGTVVRRCHRENPQAGVGAMSRPRQPKALGNAAANDNLGQPRSLKAKPRLPKAELRLPQAMPVQMVEVEVLAELLDSLPPIANDNEGDGE
jgi:hypothetical protein